MPNEQTAPSELEALFVEDNETALEGLMRSALEPVIGLTREGRLITKSPFLKLADTSKILTVLLAKQAMTRLNLPSAKPQATADQLEEICQVPLKSCRENLSRLKAKRLLEKDDAGYFVPGWAISDVCQVLKAS